MWPLLGSTRPARMRRKVDLPEPDLPRTATISPSFRRKSMWSRTRRPARSGVLKLLLTATASISTSSAMSDLPSVEAQALGGDVVEPAPEQSIEYNDIDAQHGDAESDALAMPDFGPVADIGADAGRGKRRVAQLHHLRHDAGVQRAAGGGDRAGDVGREDARQDDAPPPQPACDPEIVGGVSEIAGQRGGARDDIEENVPLRAEDHQRADPDLDIEVEAQDQHDGNRKEQIGGKRREKLNDRLGAIGNRRPEPDPHADRDPDQRGEGDQHEDAGRGGEAEQHDLADLGPFDRRPHQDYQPDQPGPRGNDEDAVPQALDPVRQRTAGPRREPHFRSPREQSRHGPEQTIGNELDQIADAS